MKILVVGHPGFSGFQNPRNTLWDLSVLGTDETAPNLHQPGTKILHGENHMASSISKPKRKRDSSPMRPKMNDIVAAPNLTNEGPPFFISRVRSFRQLNSPKDVVVLDALEARSGTPNVYDDVNLTPAEVKNEARFRAMTCDLIFPLNYIVLPPPAGFHREVKRTVKLLETAEDARSRMQCSSQLQKLMENSGAANKKQRVDTFCESYKRKSSSDKKLCNVLFAKLAAECAPAEVEDARFLVLDTPALRTQKAVRGSTGVKAKNIAIPNPFSFHCMKKKKRDGSLFNMAVGDLIKHASGSKRFSGGFHATWLDYCCTLNGPEGMCPRTDIVNYFSHGVARDGSGLAITLCARNTKAESPRQAEAETRALVDRAAQEHGYYTVFKGHHMYKGPMYFLMYTVHRI